MLDMLELVPVTLGIVLFITVCFNSVTLQCSGKGCTDECVQKF